MKNLISSRRGATVALLSLIAGLTFGSTGFAGTTKTGCGACSATPVAAVANNDYPLNTCVVSGEALGSMGAPIDHMHKEAGKPDRLVRFCCKACISDFKKEPAKYLKMIDDAAAGSASAKPKSASGHAAHGM